MSYEIRNTILKYRSYRLLMLRNGAWIVVYDSTVNVRIVQ
jgi:hypothetical protein